MAFPAFSTESLTLPSIPVLIGSLLFLYCFSLLVPLLGNWYNAWKSGLPYIVIPYNQNHFVWMVVSVPLQPYLAKYLPKWIYDRVSLTIYGFEFRDVRQPFEQYAAPQGNPMTYALVTAGKFELTTCDPEFATEILRRPNDFVQIDLASLFLGKFGPNVIISDGEVWARQRKVVAGVINERISRTIFKESIHQTKGLVDEVISDKPVGETNRMFDMMKKITINVLSGAAMGAAVEWKDDQNAQAAPGYKLSYIEAIKSIIHSFDGSLILPQWFLSNYPAFLPGQETLKRLSYAIEEFPIHTRSMLDEERQRSLAEQGETRSNIMSQLIQASEKGDKNKDGKTALSEDEMMGNLFLFTAAGFDTTANSLAYALALLCKHPQWQDWVFEEIDSIMPEDTTDLDYASIYPKAIRILALMYEVLRLYPPVIHMAKMTRTAQIVETSRGKTWLPANTTIYTNNVCLHRDPAVYRNLNLHAGEKESDTDELDFRPTRWLNVSSTEGSPFFKPPKGNFVPWSGGPRICPGQRMAQVEFTAIFLQVLHKHRIAAAPVHTASGQPETKAQLEQRLEARMRDSTPVLTLQMNDVYDVGDKQDRGLKLRLIRRRD